jgi:thiamine pyrophosphokinase
MHHYVIIANGPFLEKEIIVEAIRGKRVIALDGAADKLARLGIPPHVILGDFDSLSNKSDWGIKKTLSEQNEYPYPGKHGSWIVPMKNQHLTDLIKGIRYCDQQGAKHISLLCTTGDRLDHHEATMRALRTEYKKERPLLLHTEQQTVRFVKNETMTLQGEIGDPCGILAFPKGQFSSLGLEYDGNNHPLDFAFSESVCNRLKKQEVIIHIHGEALLIMPPQLSSQRAFIQKNTIQRLEMQLRDANLLSEVQASPSAE